MTETTVLWTDRDGDRIETVEGGPRAMPTLTTGGGTGCYLPTTAEDSYTLLNDLAAVLGVEIVEMCSVKAIPKRGDTVGLVIDSMSGQRGVVRAVMDDGKLAVDQANSSEGSVLWCPENVIVVGP